jgi:hypothetical protein
VCKRRTWFAICVNIVDYSLLIARSGMRGGIVWPTIHLRGRARVQMRRRKCEPMVQAGHRYDSPKSFGDAIAIAIFSKQDGSRPSFQRQEIGRSHGNNGARLFDSHRNKTGAKPAGQRGLAQRGSRARGYHADDNSNYRWYAKWHSEFLPLTLTLCPSRAECSRLFQTFGSDPKLLYHC